MHRLCTVVLAAAVCTFSVPRGASAAVINFAALQNQGTPVGVFGGLNSFGSSLTFGGFDFSTTNTTSYGLSVWQAGAANHPVGGVNSTSLFEYAALATTSFQQTGGGVFDLNGIDLANWGVDQGFPATFNVTFVGTRPDSSTVTQILTVSNSGVSGASPVLQSFTFNGFTGLSSVSMVQGIYGAGTAYQFDNIVVNAGAAAAVPEPTTLLMLGSGLAGLGPRLRRRFRRRQALTTG